MGLFDIDKIEKNLDLRITDIFRLKGEEYFRKIEEKTTLDILKEANNVIALGGGAFLNHRIRSKISKNDCTIWLKWNTQTLILRLYGNRKRPITHELKKKDLVNLIEKRSKIYSMAKFKLSCEKLKKSEIVEKLLEIYDKK